MRRRGFIARLGAAAWASSWPHIATAQQVSRVARVGFVNYAPEQDPNGLAVAKLFRQGMEKLGWTLGHNLVIDYRWGVFEAETARLAATEILRLAPDVIVCGGTPATRALKQATTTVPIVFADVSEPLGQGIVESLAHPGGNLTGFSFLEASIGAKWLELLMQIAPHLRHVAFLSNPVSYPQSRFFFQSIEIASSKFAVQAAMGPIHDLSDVEPFIATLGRQPDSGMIVASEVFNWANRKLIIELAARHRVPTIYGLVDCAPNGGLIQYSFDYVATYGEPVAAYVDKILRGAKLGDLPVQQPNKFNLTINLKTAVALGLNVPAPMLALADDVIE
jgi:putative tryptophan/tyrosine transport system substrate-binding protein